MIDKPIVDDEYYAATCPKCKGAGEIEFGYKTRQIEICYSCDGKGWQIRKKPRITKKGEVERPIYIETEYGKSYREKYGRRAPSESRKYMTFRHELKRYLLSHRGNKCQNCGCVYKTQKDAMDSLQVHHVIPVKDGGEDNDDNLILLCFDCHQGKHEHRIQKNYGKW